VVLEKGKLIKMEKKNNTFTIVDNHILESEIFINLSPAACKLYLLLRKYSDFKYKPCWPGLRELSRATGLSLPTLMKCVTELEVASLIQVAKGKNNKNIYKFLKCSNNFNTECSKDFNTSAKESLTECSKNFNKVFKESRQNHILEQDLKNNNKKDVVVSSEKNLLLQNLSKKSGIDLVTLENLVDKFKTKDIDLSSLLEFISKKDLENPAGFVRKAVQEKWKFNQYLEKKKARSKAVNQKVRDFNKKTQKDLSDQFATYYREVEDFKLRKPHEYEKYLKLATQDILKLYTDKSGPLFKRAIVLELHKMISEEELGDVDKN
jgi:hypothetical protein